MLKPKHSPKESRSNNLQEKEKKDGSRGIQPNCVARVNHILYFIINSYIQKMLKNLVKSRIAMFERKQSLPN